MIARNESYWVLGQRVTFVHTEPGCSTFEILAPAAYAGPPPHVHHDAAEYFYGISGTFEVLLNGSWQFVEPGQNITAPKGSLHTFRNRGDTEARFLVMFRPGGFEKFFRDLGMQAGSDNAASLSISEERIKRVLSTAQQYAMEIPVSV